MDTGLGRFDRRLSIKGLHGTVLPRHAMAFVLIFPKNSLEMEAAEALKVSSAALSGNVVRSSYSSVGFTAPWKGKGPAKSVRTGIWPK